MELDLLQRKYNDVMQQKMNSEYRISQLEKNLQEQRQELAKLEGKLKLIEELAEEEQEQAAARSQAAEPTPEEQERMAAAEKKRDARRAKQAEQAARQNGAGEPAPEVEPGAP